MNKFPSHCCQKCGENIGYVGRFLLFGLLHKCKISESENNLMNAKKHAIIALAYWDDCTEDSDIHICIESSSTYVRLGKNEIHNIPPSK